MDAGCVSYENHQVRAYAHREEVDRRQSRRQNDFVLKLLTAASLAVDVENASAAPEALFNSPMMITSMIHVD